jgi:hypothetical protein
MPSMCRAVGVHPYFSGNAVNLSEKSKGTGSPFRHTPQSISARTFLPGDSCRQKLKVTNFSGLPEISTIVSPTSPSACQPDPGMQTSGR